MNRGYLGIDLGTSSVKALCRYEDGSIVKAKAKYDDNSPESWYQSVIRVITDIASPEIVSIGLTSQVGTYIVNEREVISWSSPIGTEELRSVKSTYDQPLFIQEISMPHPDIISYPIPRISYIRKHWGGDVRICQPKDLLGKMLTGEYATDPYSWRGLANLQNTEYSAHFLKVLGNPELPPIKPFTAKLGMLLPEIQQIVGLPKSIPVYVGLNDFFSALAGMGITSGDAFDITGTSEHLGIITESLAADTKMVSGPFLHDYVHYGVTASSGASLNFGKYNFGYDRLNIQNLPVHNAPVFLPYLNGERAPVFDSNAAGVFFGMNGSCSSENLGYSVLEGVAFSLFHIRENIGEFNAPRMIVGGGAADNPILNYLKAELFGIPVMLPAEKDASALGAAMAAAVGCGAYPDMTSASKHFCTIKEQVMPTGKLKPLLQKRYEIYRELYPQLKHTFKKWKENQL